MGSDHDLGWFIIYLIISLIEACIFGAITKVINERHGYEGGFWWGFFLRVIGIIVVACRQPAYNAGYYSSGNSIMVPEKSAETPIDLDAPVPTGGWRCICGRAHAPYESSCACGQSKRAVLDGTATATRFVPRSTPAPQPPPPQDWTCHCGRQHQSYETSCICGQTKHEVLTANIVIPEFVPSPVPEVLPEPADDEQSIQALRKYKALLDDGTITQEDYDLKKKQLLGL